MKQPSPLEAVNLPNGLCDKSLARIGVESAAMLCAPLLKFLRVQIDRLNRLATLTKFGNGFSLAVGKLEAADA